MSHTTIAVICSLVSSTIGFAAGFWARGN